MANRGRTLDPDVFSIKDLKERASRKTAQDYFHEGAMDMITLRDNEAAFNRYRVRPRSLRNVSVVDTTTTIWGSQVLFSFGFSPAAMHRITHPDGEVGTPKVCAALNIGMGLSAYPNDLLEDVIEQAEGKTNPYAVQVILLKSQHLTTRLLKRAEKAGYKAILLTVDAPFLGRRLIEFRNAFCMPKGTTYPTIAPGVDLSNLEEGGDNELAYVPENGVDWEQAICFVKSHTNLELWIKGLYTAEDVVTAIQSGLDGVVISIHGGRQLDGVPATLDAWRECAPVAKGKIKIAIDGGIRRGIDIFKTLALGASFCFSGRIPIWGLAYNGHKGVELDKQLLYDEFRLTMGLAGCKSIAEINRGHPSILQSNGVLAKR
ncbi:hypothetical protein A1O7_02701 [Cladophialophora yegresii CBS 114405]|uniref:FMN hydroxy acid dehydrogenase domain-containing protein n=1 Tax=Cladophialophora yegresii CBS 114405 TaxID=1182544 RepID=W9W2R8_9EURO|nr:uncharacterized protein A1O7_02701 [Cladophialophora yegresii CBS 114405]EXJ62268.1 hypothetical protein A1O7_02701 [Cladophialophora yegresii CBS 114405]